MRDPPTRADGGPRDRLDRIAAIADDLEDIGATVRAAAAAGSDDADTGPGIQHPDAPSPESYADVERYLEEAQAWVTDELLAAAADLEHRTLELQQALEVYPGVGAERPEADTHRDVVVEDMEATTGALERLLLAGTRLAQLEAAHTEG